MRGMEENLLLFFGVGEADVALPFAAVGRFAAAARIHLDDLVGLLGFRSRFFAGAVAVAVDGAFIALFRFGISQCEDGCGK